MTREDTIKLVGVITAAYPGSSRFSDPKAVRAMVGVWANIFADDDAVLVALAVREHISTSTWPPSIAEIREGMVRITRPDLVPPEAAWLMVSKCLDEAGERDYSNCRKELPKLIAETVDAIKYGNLYAMRTAYICGRQDKAGADRAAFLAAYKPRYEQELRNAMLPDKLRQQLADRRSDAMQSIQKAELSMSGRGSESTANIARMKALIKRLSGGANSETGNH